MCMCEDSVVLALCSMFCAVMCYITVLCANAFYYVTWC
uniref:Uncharacterized protein n=1 Tax=Anguilla anguilla TaxID=7936 RepID=A0A0E9XC38_ANGAN